ncbi:hypothetical protein [Hymenobacter psychrotolerans]|uniref:Outer membrane protein beta-barrel domain-containing protein n=1 Tax=Hymenobacter psychrotolerans DSM 18569 TaxID=1121959 RepID=A0A1M7A9Y6_9BACT|nr:hypothetical protein [Hymenobacter psychrotolerans]SHL39482.1 hypothetical protein SAMN02746009_02654 [Hymenobacter psychrotolerans DSM 18569]
MKHFLLISTFAAGMVLAHAAAAQDGPERRKRHYSSQARAYYRGPVRFTAGGGVALYNGDLAGDLGNNLPGGSGSLGILYLLRPRLVIGGEATYFQIGAKDQLAERGLAFRGRNVSGVTFLRYELLRDESEFASPKRPAALIKPFVKAGAGFLLYNPKSYIGTLRPDDRTPFLSPERKDYPALAVTAPVGLGIVFRLTPKLNATAEAAYFFTTTDQLDDVSPVSGRSSSSLNDGYGLVELKLEYAPWGR